jgi:hypothetical protein
MTGRYLPAIRRLALMAFKFQAGRVEDLLAVFLNR